MSELEVPYAAWNALQYVQDERDDDVVRAIAAPVVIAELREQARQLRAVYGRRDMQPRGEGALRAADLLDRRADELEGQS
jgi:hypothetical protein